MSSPVVVRVEALVTHARHVPAVERSRFADAARAALSGGALVLETCHRVEAYVGSADVAARIAPFLPHGGEVLSGEPAVRHAVAVAVGRDSVVVGEDQVLHQLRVSVDAARAGGTLDRTLERLFTLALQAGRRARSWRQGPTRSLADVALESIQRHAGPLAGRSILVVGAGIMGRVAARAAIAAGASVAVASRSAAAAEALAAGSGGRSEPFDPGPGIGGYAGVIVALRGPWPIAATTVEVLAGREIPVVDLSVPAAVPTALGDALGGRLVTADALALGAGEQAVHDRGIDRLDALVERTSAEFLGWLGRRDGRAAAEALVRRADLRRQAELAALWRRLPDLEPDARAVIEEMTRHFAEHLLREPLERLGRDADGRDERAIRDLFAL